ncbi:hypothetical protein [Nitrospirillum pindoramense]|uniref:Uncharacterized protein n=1 Tax=Nitrospirillum amazonense TaxID=28077 RepID=A0A560H2W1_9PROT|nr:hypothetical protein [Nitrospirillum amazonense]TWB40638.1 hypothetical protein FBZ90_109241 [Nitrospirillum amazonense]
MNESATLLRHQVALLWVMTAIGSLIYAVMQLLTYLSAYIANHGATPEIVLDAGALWAFAILYVLWLVPPLLAVTVRSGAANWSMLLLGGLLVLGGTLGGIFDGIRDGGHIMATALIAVTLPGVIALRATWRLLRNDRNLVVNSRAAHDGAPG